jgi:hypothetical protein
VPGRPAPRAMRRIPPASQSRLRQSPPAPFANWISPDSLWPGLKPQLERARPRAVRKGGGGRRRPPSSPQPASLIVCRDLLRSRPCRTPRDAKAQLPIPSWRMTAHLPGRGSSGFSMGQVQVGKLDRAVARAPGPLSTVEVAAAVGISDAQGSHVRRLPTGTELQFSSSIGGAWRSSPVIDRNIPDDRQTMPCDAGAQRGTSLSCAAVSLDQPIAAKVALRAPEINHEMLLPATAWQIDPGAMRRSNPDGIAADASRVRAPSAKAVCRPRSRRRR